MPLVAVAALAVEGVAQQSDGGIERSSDPPVWLAGCWVARAPGVRIDEVWMAPEDGFMVGMSRTLRDGRPPSWELLALGERDGALTYSAHPSGQALAHFPAVRVAPDTLRFENPEHDFPRAIEYRRIAPDSVLALVFGEGVAPRPSFGLSYAREACPGA